MEYKKPDVQVKKVWFINRLISFFIVFLICIGTCTLAYFAWKDLFFAFLICSAIILLWRLIALLLYPAIEYRQWFYATSSEKIEIKHGIFFIKNTIIPILRIQHISIEQGPIARKFQLCTLNFSLASGSFKIVGLTYDVATDISNAVKDGIYYNLNESETSL